MVETSDLGKPQRGPTVFDITCSLQAEDADDLKVTWRWIKDDVSDVRFTDDFKNGRIEIMDDDNKGKQRNLAVSLFMMKTYDKMPNTRGIICGPDWSLFVLNSANPY